MKKKALEEYRLRNAGSVSPNIKKTGEGSTPVPSPRPSPAPSPIPVPAAPTVITPPSHAAASPVVSPPSPDVKLPEIPSRPSTTPRQPQVTDQSTTFPQIQKDKPEIEDSRRPYRDSQDVGITIKGGDGGKHPQRNNPPPKEIINPYDEAEDDAMQTSLSIGPEGGKSKGAPARKRSMPQQVPRSNVPEDGFSAEIGGVGRGPRKTSRDQLSGVPPNSDETSKTSGSVGGGKKKGAGRLVILGDGQQEEFDRRLSGVEGSGSYLSGSQEFGSGELGISGTGGGSRDDDKSGVSVSQRRSELKGMKRGDVSKEGYGLVGGIDEEGVDTSGEARRKRGERRGMSEGGDWGPDYKAYSHNKAQSEGTGGRATTKGGYGISRTTGDTGTLDEYDYDENKRKIAGRNAGTVSFLIVINQTELQV